MDKKIRILIVDDEPLIGDIVGTALTRAGYEVTFVEDGQKAIDVFLRQPFDLVILDIMMPGMDGFAVCEWLRARSNVPIVMLTAKGSTQDIVRGFKLGADDYITKPFTVRELEARIEAILRRMAWMDEPKPEKVIVMGDLSVDAESRKALLKGQPLQLTPIEFELLYYLMTHAGEAIEKQKLFREVWGYDFAGGGNLVEVGVRRLREKIERDPSAPQYIQTVRGIGYRFVASPQA